MNKFVAVILSIWVIAGLAANGQDITAIHDFTHPEGANPAAALTLGPDGIFYGTTYYGGTSSDGSKETGYGTVFKITTDGTLTTLVNFNLTNGANPFAGLTWALDGNLYGTTESGGSGGNGTVCKVTTNGLLTTLVQFKNDNGPATPDGTLRLGSDVWHKF